MWGLPLARDAPRNYLLFMATLNPIFRAAIFLRDEGECVYCRRLANEIDHVVPTAHGGTDDAGNLVACCSECKQEKGVIHVKAFFYHRVLWSRPNTDGQEERVAAALARPLDMGAAFAALMGSQNLAPRRGPPRWVTLVQRPSFPRSRHAPPIRPPVPRHGPARCGLPWRRRRGTP